MGKLHKCKEKREHIKIKIGRELRGSNRMNVCKRLRKLKRDKCITEIEEIKIQ